MLEKIFGVETISNIVVCLQEFADVPVVCLRPYLVYLHSLRRVRSAGSNQVGQFKKFMKTVSFALSVPVICILVHNFLKYICCKNCGE
jgi:hypothetical protein